MHAEYRFWVYVQGWNVALLAWKSWQKLVFANAAVGACLQV